MQSPLLFVSDSQSAETTQPTDGALDLPSIAAQLRLWGFGGFGIFVLGRTVGSGVRNNALDDPALLQLVAVLL